MRFGVLVLSSLLVSVAPQDASDEARNALLVAKRAVIDGGYQSDAQRVSHGVASLKRLAADPRIGYLANYYAGYGNWQLSLFAAPDNPKKIAGYNEEAATLLELAVQQEPDFAEAQALLAHCYSSMMFREPSLGSTLARKTIALRNEALTLAPRNPRIILIEALSLYYRPPQFGGDKPRAIERWHEALELFAREAHSDPLLPDWGHAEAWAWLSGTYSAEQGPHREKAIAAMAKAVELRPDFLFAKRQLAELKSAQQP